MSEKHPDQRYLEGLAQNDYQILAEIDQRYRGILTNWVRNNSGNTEDAEDLFTETLLAIFDRLQKPEPLILTRPFSAYFMGVAKNKWFEQLRKRKKEERVRNDQVQQYIDESEESIEEELIQIEAASERFQRLEKTFVQLSELCQQLIDLFFNRGLSTSEIVARLNFNSEDTYYVRKKKCLDRWRTLLGESQHPFGALNYYQTDAAKRTSMRTDDYKLIDQYLRGELDEAGQQEVKSRIDSDEDFAEELRFQEEIKSFAGHREKRKALKEQLTQLNQKSEKKAKVIPLRRRIFYIAGAAAAIALVIYLALPFLMPGTLFDQFNDHQQLALQERGDNTTLPQEAENAFNAGNYELAYAKLSDLVQATPDDSRAQLALGITALETDKLAEAKTIFNTLSNGDSAVKDNATWYLALTYVKAEDYANARQTLERIPEGTFWSGKANELMEALKQNSPKKIQNASQSCGAFSKKSSSSSSPFPTNLLSFS